MASERPQRAPFFQPGEIPRLLAMVTLLGVVAMLMFQVRDPSMWKFLADDADDQAAAQPPAKKPAKAPDAKSASAKPQEATAAPQSSETKTGEMKTDGPKTDGPKTDEAKKPDASAAPPGPPTSEDTDSKPSSPAADTKPAVAAPAKSPVAEAPVIDGTDLDPEEQAEFKKDIDRIKDLTLEIQPLEMKPYLRLFHWTQLQSLDALRARAVKPQAFREYAQRRSADDHRGELIRLDLDVRMINVLPVNQFPEFEALGIDQIYEIYGTTEQSKPYFWCCVATSLPEGMKTGEVNAHAKFYGFFFKVHAYVPKNAPSGNKVWPAPLIVGRLDWQPPPKVTAAPPVWDEKEWIIGGGLAGLVILGGILIYFLNSKRRPTFSGSLPTPEASAAGFAQFLEHGSAEAHYADGPPLFDPSANGHSGRGHSLPFSDQSET